MKRILDIFKEQRAKQKLSTRDMGKLLNMSYGTYRDIENGKIRLSLDNFLLICEKLNLQPIQLLKEDNQTYILLTEKDISNLDLSIELLNKIKAQTQPTANATTNIKANDNAHIEYNHFGNTYIEKKE